MNYNDTLTEIADDCPVAEAQVPRIPAIRHEREQGHSYELIRDRIRRHWEPTSR